MLFDANPTDEVMRLYVYYIFARKFGWTPNEVDQLPHRIVKGLIVMLRADAKRKELEMSERELMSSLGELYGI